jgi:predicted dehydrogenase
MMPTRPTLAVIGLGKYYQKLRSGIDQHFMPVLKTDIPELIRSDGDLRGLVARSQPDAIMILTPNSAHAEQALQLADLGLPILVEKPLTTTEEGLALILEAAKINPSIYCSDFYADVRAVPMLSWAKRPRATCLDKWIRAEANSASILELGLASLGPIISTEAVLLEGEGEAASFEGRDWLWDSIHGGVLWDLAYHYLILWHFLFGDALTIKSWTANTAGHTRGCRLAETHASLTLSSNSHGRFVIRAEKYHQGRNERWFRIRGMNGEAVMIFQFPYLLRVRTATGECRISLAGSDYAHVSEAFQDYVKRQTTRPYGLDAAVQAIRLVTAVKRAIAL